MRLRRGAGHGERRHSYGSISLDGVTLREPSRQPNDMHAVDFIIEMASRYRGELVLATIGPETNIALALRRKPRLRQWVAEITVMGGSTGNGSVTAAAFPSVWSG